MRRITLTVHKLDAPVTAEDKFGNGYVGRVDFQPFVRGSAFAAYAVELRDVFAATGVVGESSARLPFADLTDPSVIRAVLGGLARLDAAATERLKVDYAAHPFIDEHVLLNLFHAEIGEVFANLDGPGQITIG